MTVVNGVPGQRDPGARVVPVAHVRQRDDDAAPGVEVAA